MANGLAIIINDVPDLRDPIAQRLTQNGYKYMFVDSEEEAEAVLPNILTDTIIRASEFEFGYSAFGKIRARLLRHT